MPTKNPDRTTIISRRKIASLPPSRQKFLVLASRAHVLVQQLALIITIIIIPASLSPPVPPTALPLLGRETNKEWSGRGWTSTGEMWLPSPPETIDLTRNKTPRPTAYTSIQIIVWGGRSLVAAALKHVTNRATTNQNNNGQLAPTSSPSNRQNEQLRQAWI